MVAESKIEKAVCEYAEEQGYLVRKLQWIGRRGAPDRFFTSRAGRVSFMIEFKAPGEMLGPDQAREIEKLRDSGFTVFVCDDEDEGRKFVHEAILDIL